MPFPTNRLLRSRRRVGDCIHALVTLFVHPYHAVDVSPVTEGCDDPFVLHQTCFMIRRRNRAPAVPDWHGGGALPDTVRRHLRRVEGCATRRIRREADDWSSSTRSCVASFRSVVDGRGKNHTKLASAQFVVSPNFVGTIPVGVIPPPWLRMLCFPPPFCAVSSAPGVIGGDGESSDGPDRIRFGRLGEF